MPARQPDRERLQTLQGIGPAVDDGSEILVRPQTDGTIEIGGRVEMVETREYDLGQ